MNTILPMIDVRNLHKTYGALEVLKGITLQVARGEIIAIIGPSGSGKSTLLRSLNQLETVNAGEIFLDGVQVNQPGTGRAAERHLNAVRQQMGMVFQHFDRSADSAQKSSRILRKNEIIWLCPKRWSLL